MNCIGTECSDHGNCRGLHPLTFDQDKYTVLWVLRNRVILEILGSRDPHVFDVRGTCYKECVRRAYENGCSSRRPFASFDPADFLFFLCNAHYIRVMVMALAALLLVFGLLPLFFLNVTSTSVWFLFVVAITLAWAAISSGIQYQRFRNRFTGNVAATAWMAAGGNL